MEIAILSGKGGTGKTLVSVNLAAVSPGSSYIDCDVEEPNGHLFFKPQQIVSENIAVKIPVVDDQRCNGCRICVDFCRFNALAYFNDKLRIFDDICHSCGGCTLLCPEEALTEVDKNIGVIQRGISADIKVATGILNTGEPAGIPIIENLLQGLPETGTVFIDCPPGSACIVMESIKDADYCILVAEPTLFGVHNLAMVHELVKLFNKPHGAVLNKCLPGENPAEVYCRENGVTILGRIPFDHELSYLNSNGLIAAREEARYQELFSSLLQKVLKEVPDAAAIDSQR